MLVLAGGKGTRLWPLSRRLMPKQFIRIFEGKSLFQKTIQRALLHAKPEDIFIVTNKEYKFRVLDDLRDIDVKIPEENIILEPDSKNTLPAVTFGLLEIERKYNNSNVLVLPSDHYVRPNRNYENAVKIADEIAGKYLVVFGVKPKYANAGYGYINPEEDFGKYFTVYEFKEKPNQKLAEEYVKKGYFWNSGMFVFNTKLFFEELKRHSPEIYYAFSVLREKDILEKLSLSEDEIVSRVYSAIPSISVDYGLLEKSKGIAMVPLNTEWNDLGSFDSIYEIFSKDRMGNASLVQGRNADVISINSKNNLIITQRLTATIGLDDLTIIDTGDALLITKRGESQKVKEVYKILEKRKDNRIEVHRTAYRPWGNYTVLEENDRFKIKRLTVLPKKRLSLQRHYHRSEHWVVVKGIAKATVGDKEIILKPGESVFIPAYTIHRLENLGVIPLEIIEVQIGEYLEEDDIERFQDDFGRTTS